MLVGAGDQAEAPGVEGLFGASLVFLLFCPFVAFPAEGYFWLPVPSSLGRVLQ